MYSIRPLHNKKVYIENDYAGIWTCRGLMFLRYRDDMVVDLTAAKKILEHRLALCRGKEYPVLNDCKGVRYWTKEARECQNTPENYELYKAVTIIITKILPRLL